MMKYLALVVALLGCLLNYFTGWWWHETAGSGVAMAVFLTEGLVMGVLARIYSGLVDEREFQRKLEEWK